MKPNPFAKGKALFKGKETKAEEKAEKKAFPSKKAYAKAEAKFEKPAKGVNPFAKMKK